MSEGMMVSTTFEENMVEIKKYAHMCYWLPDWDIFETIYKDYPLSYSVLTPFAYAYLEELIRSMTPEYGVPLQGMIGGDKGRSFGKSLIALAIKENKNNVELIELLEETKPYYSTSHFKDCGDNRNSVMHGLLPPVTWEKDSFEDLIYLIARLSKYSGM